MVAASTTFGEAPPDLRADLPLPPGPSACGLGRLPAGGCGGLAIGLGTGGTGTVLPAPLSRFHRIGFPLLCWQPNDFAAASCALARRDSLIRLDPSLIKGNFSESVSRRRPTLTSTTRR